MRQDEFGIIDKYVINEKLILLNEIKVYLLGYMFNKKELEPYIDDIMSHLNRIEMQLKKEKEG